MRKLIEITVYFIYQYDVLIRLFNRKHAWILASNIKYDECPGTNSRIDLTLTSAPRSA